VGVRVPPPAQFLIIILKDIIKTNFQIFICFPDAPFSIITISESILSAISSGVFAFRFKPIGV
jgi:hypothetical protein